MTIICPRCAARFTVAGTTGIACPACGARLALREDSSRRSTTPATTTRRPSPSAPVVDLPVPKRGIGVALDPSLAGLAMGPAAGFAKRPTRGAGERWRLRPEQAQDLPIPVSATPRAGRAVAVKAAAPAKLTAAPTPALAAVATTVPERPERRIPVTRPEIPAGPPTRLPGASGDDVRPAIAAAVTR